MIVSQLFVQAAHANGVINSEEFMFIMNYGNIDPDVEDENKMEELSQRLILWSTPPYNTEYV